MTLIILLFKKINVEVLNSAYGSSVVNFSSIATEDGFPTRTIVTIKILQSKQTHFFFSLHVYWVNVIKNKFLLGK